MHRILTGFALVAGLMAASISSANAQYYGYQLPPGSYQQTCSNERMNGSTLSASCSTGTGQWVYSSINVNRCGGQNIINANGYLACANGYNGNGNGYQNGNGRRRHHRHDNDNDNDDGNNNGNGYYNNSGYNGGYPNGGYPNGSYGYRALPPGSYQLTCTNERMNGPTLSASCTSSSNQQVYSSINVNRCASGQVRNVNGYLRCQ